MAYVDNVIAFLEECIFSDHKFAIYNYIDTPDLSMNELVSQVRWKLKQKKGVGVRIPKSTGLIIGYVADIVSGLTGKSFPISLIRVKNLFHILSLKVQKTT